MNDVIYKLHKAAEYLGERIWITKDIDEIYVKKLLDWLPVKKLELTSGTAKCYIEMAIYELMKKHCEFRVVLDRIKEAADYEKLALQMRKEDK